MEFGLLTSTLRVRLSVDVLVFWATSAVRLTQILLAVVLQSNTVCVSKDPTMHFYPLEENRFQAGPVVFPQENYLIQEKQGIAKLFVWVSGG